MRAVGARRNLRGPPRARRPACSHRETLANRLPRAPLRAPMPPRRSSRLVVVQLDNFVVQDYVLDPRLVADVLAAVFALVPVDSRLRCREVSRAWKAFLDQPWLWQSCSLTPASGLVAKPSCALLLAATARAQGQLRELDVAGCNGFTFPTLLEVVRANRAALTTLRAWCAVSRPRRLAFSSRLRLGVPRSTSRM